MTPIELLRSEAEYLAACLSDLNERSASIPFTDEQTADFEAGKKLLAEKVALIKRHNEVADLAQIPEAREAGDGATFTPPGVVVRDANPHDISDVHYGDGDGMRTKALAAIERTDGMEDRHKEQTERLVRSLDASLAAKVALTSAPAYRSGFLKAAGGYPELLDESERAALNTVKRALALGGTAGYPVPTLLDPTIIDTGSHSTNPFRQVSTIKQITTTSWNGVSSAGVTASWDAEAAEVSDDAPTLAQISIPTFKGQVFVPFSVESEDWAGMEADVRRMIAVAKDDLEGAAFVSGNGTSAPQGVTTALDGTSSEIAPGTAETFARADITKLVSSVQARYRRNGAFVANQVWYDAIRAFETTVNVGALLSDMPVDYSGQYRLAGYPAYESSDMDAVLPNAAATADNFGLLFGDFAQGYYIVDRVGLTVELVPHLFHTSNNRPSGQRGFLAWFRTGAEVVNASALAMLSIPTAA